MWEEDDCFPSISSRQTVEREGRGIEISLPEGSRGEVWHFPGASLRAPPGNMLI